MFIDLVKLRLISGNGGAGSRSFRREKFVPLGGPDGGDGGRGGDVVLECKANMHSLVSLKGRVKLAAKNGVPGSGRNKNGKKGEDLIVPLPPGSCVYDESGNLLADLTKDGERVILLEGGLGGLGNRHFKSSTNQKPDYAQPGRPGIDLKVKIELKLLADLGLVGFPNVGKSTLLSLLSSAKPEIANYEFTTLTPHLGVVDAGDFSFVLADIPGIIKGASSGKGLGLAFLRHVSRAKSLLFVLDAAREMSVKEQYGTLLKELKDYGIELLSFGIVFSRIDAAKEDFAQQKEDFLKELASLPKPAAFVQEISAITKEGLDELRFKAASLLQTKGEM